MNTSIAAQKQTSSSAGPSTGDIPSSSSAGSNVSRQSIGSLLEKQGRARCTVYTTSRGDWFITADDADLVSTSFSITLQPLGDLGLPTPEVFIHRLQGLCVLNDRLTGLSRELLNLHGPDSEGFVLPLFRQRGPRGLEYGVLVGRQHRAADDWGEGDLPSGYAAPLAVSRSDYCLDRIDQVLYPENTVVTDPFPHRPVVEHQHQHQDDHAGTDTSPASKLTSSSPPRRSSTSTSTSTSGPPLLNWPRFVLQVGRLCVANPSDASSHRAPAKSSYVVVMDIVSPHKPVWIIHDAFTRDADGLVPREAQRHRSGVAFATAPAYFDMAPLLGSVQDWGKLKDEEEEEEEERDGSRESEGEGGGMEARVAARGARVEPLLSLAWSGRLLEAAKKAGASAV
ncbi:hypothetical protein UCRPA7_218 [Phaeoacremonium minimum UCRPA7]|uniref:Uncharacterized protein n=1 Tax=Phaeoacremonium minimum (strain UCR-PA7) TaxID=1286976 RepID=R8BY45_PHAM7|nr:hypothetical protein UCRPA7_218 [Phaeoacremonium minimum UCRPA7]EOO04250.1 hypothetical protein UCRPA7_218 [Phaeoacremonium minimum UCRPA7]